MFLTNVCSIRSICQKATLAAGLSGVTILSKGDPRRSTEVTRIHINNIPELDWLIALEFGRVDEGQQPELWHGVTEQFGYLYNEEGRALGFKALEVSNIDLSRPEYAELWSGPQFCAPTLALESAPAAEVILAARAFFDGSPSINRIYFSEAIESAGSAQELFSWQACIETGDCMAHYGLGVALMERGDAKRAYKHLRYYATIAPYEPWAQYWYARAALASDQRDEAARALQRATALAHDEDLRRAADELAREISD